MTTNAWMNAATFSDKISAEALLQHLTGEGIPAYLRSDEHVPGLGQNFSVLVPPDQIRQATLIIEQSRVSERELTYLATGEFPGPKEDY